MTAQVHGSPKAIAALRACGALAAQDALVARWSALKWGTIEHKTLKNADGTPLRARVNGQIKTWKTRPGEFSLPMKHGMYECFYITERNADEWELPDA